MPVIERRPADSAVPRAAAVVGIVAALAALVGWQLGVEWLKSVVPAQATMNPASALALLLLSGALWLDPSHASAPGSTWGARVCSAAALLLAAIRLSGYVATFDPGIDQMLFGARVAASVPPSRMAPQTALSCLLIGLALLLRERPSRPALLGGQAAAMVAGMVALMGIVGHAYGGRAAYGSMSFNTAAVLFILALGVLRSQPERGFMRVVLSDTATGGSARRLLLLAGVILVALGWLRVLGEHAGLYDSAYGTALFTVLPIGLFVGLILWNAQGLLRSEHALHEGEERLFQILEAMPVAVFVLDHTGRPYYANRSSREILGKDIVPSAAPAQLPEVYQAFVRGTDEPYPVDRQPLVHAMAGEPTYVADIEIHRPDRIVPIEVWGAPVFNARREVEFAIAAFSDITERLRAEAALKQYAAELEAANAELNAFAYYESHDLRAPLRSIDGFSMALLEDHGPQLEPAAREHLGRVRAAAQRMAELIDDLLALSRITRSEIAVAPVDLSEVARAVVSELGRAEPARRVEVAVMPGLTVRGDVRLLRLVLENLLDNAWKFTSKRPRARIEVGMVPRDGVPAYFVRDDGAGFDMAHAAKLFGAFQRLHDVREFAGTGIGLATVQRIIQRHGGRVWAESTAGQGATFFFTLPGAG